MIMFITCFLVQKIFPELQDMADQGNYPIFPGEFEKFLELKFDDDTDCQWPVSEIYFMSG